jgi:hypothetical protein
MSHPHAGMQLKTGIRIQVYFHQLTETICNIKLECREVVIPTRYEPIVKNLDPYYILHDDYFLECDEGDLKYNMNCQITDLISCAIEQQKYKKQQLIEEEIRKKKEIDNIIIVNSMESQLTANDGGLLCTTHCEVIEDIRQEVTEMVPVRSVEVNSPINIEENQKSCAVIENAEDAQALSEKQESSPSISGGTTSIDISSSITSSLDSGGTSFISSQVLPALYLGSSTPLPTSILISTPPQLDPTPASGGTSTGASSADNPSIFSVASIMPLLPPRTGIGVQVSSPPPTASSCSTGVYAFTSSASPENIADNPDNPDLGFDHSGDVPDNPRKSASTFWTFIASRG